MKWRKVTWICIALCRVVGYSSKVLRCGPCVTRDHTVLPAPYRHHTLTIPDSKLRHQLQCVTTLWLVLIVPTHEGMARLSWPGWLVTYTKINVPHRELNPHTVTHLGTNRARRRLTSLIETNALPLRQTATRCAVMRETIVVYSHRVSCN